MVNYPPAQGSGGGGGSGGVSSVTNSDGSILVTPNTGAVVVEVNPTGAATSDVLAFNGTAFTHAVIAFQKGATVLTPSAGKSIIWRAPYACTVTAVKAIQDVGTGSVLTAYDGGTDLLNTDITIAVAGTWQDGGTLALTAVAAGDSIAIDIVSLAGTPNYVAIQVEFTRP